MGILINVGVRDETQQSSGALLAIKNTYLKTLKHTNETINYGMIQMSGGEAEMEFDEETMWYNTHCFEYDATDMFRMLADCAFEPRSFLAANVARDKNKKFHKLQHHLGHYNPFGANPQLLLTTAYGYQGLGMPKWGMESNIDNIDQKLLQDFQLNTITPEKTIIVANGVKKHEEFVDLVNSHLGVLNAAREFGHKRENSTYFGGESRQFSESPETNVILAYESVPWTHPLMPAYALMHTMFGGATGFSVGGPGKGMLNRAYRNILRSKFYVSSCESINLHFTDTGLFGFNFTGNSAYGKNIVEDIMETFEGFRRPVDEVELNRAKNILKRSILSNIANQVDRLEETARSVRIYWRHNFINFFIKFLVQYLRKCSQ
jgi:predicted Zn-dependent peptidase